MQTVTPILVHVVNSGTDWLALAAVISTGVVGLAGIGAGLWQASRGWNREEKRAKMADKRRVYAAYLATLHNGVAAGVKHLVYQNNDATEQFAQSMVAAQIAVNEVRLIAPPDIVVKAGDVLSSLVKLTRETLNNQTTQQPVLMMAMRRDLGESTWPL